MRTIPIPLSSQPRHARPVLRRRGRRVRRTSRRTEPTVVVLPGGMVDIALRELGAVLTRIDPLD